MRLLRRLLLVLLLLGLVTPGWCVIAGLFSLLRGQSLAPAFGIVGGAALLALGVLGVLFGRSFLSGIEQGTRLDLPAAGALLVCLVAERLRVRLRMLGLRLLQFEVVRRVVALVEVLVVDYFSWKQRATELLLHHQSASVNAATFPWNGDEAAAPEPCFALPEIVSRSAIGLEVTTARAVNLFCLPWMKALATLFALLRRFQRSPHDRPLFNYTRVSLITATICLGVSLASPGLCVLSGSTVWEVRASGASDTQGGGYAPLTVSTFSGTDLVVDASLNTKVTSVTHNFVAADVGTRIYITNVAGGAWTAGFYTINSVAANAATLSSSPAAINSTGGIWLETGVDYSQQNGQQVNIDNAAITTSITANVITFTGYTASAKDIGNVVHMNSGTNVTAGFYQITAFTASTWTVTGAAALPTSGTTTNALGKMGGAISTFATLAGTNCMVASNKAYITGSFAVTNGITFAQNVTPTGAAPPTRLIGYGAARGDSTHATVTLSTNTGQIVINGTGGGIEVEQIDVDCGTIGTSTGVALAISGLIQRCKVSNFTSNGIAPSGVNVTIQDCELTGGVAGATAAILQGNAGTDVMRCFIHDNACTAIRISGACSAEFNLLCNNTGATTYGVLGLGVPLVISNNTIHNNGLDGIRVSTANAAGLAIRNNILTNNGGFGLTLSTGTALPAAAEYDGNAYGGGASANTSGAVAGAAGAIGYSMAGIYGVNPYVPTRDVTLSGSPYIGPTSGGTANFGLLATGAGLQCRGTGAPGAFPGLATTMGFLSMGAVQPVGGGVPQVITAP